MVQEVAKNRITNDPFTFDIIENSLAPIFQAGKWYKNNGSGGANTNWARMDGVSNANPGSGQDREGFFIRGNTAAAVLTNISYGRPNGYVDNDIVQILVEVDDHPDHMHTVDTDQCDCSDPATPDSYYFANQNNIPTSIQKQFPSQAPLTLDHQVTVNLINNDAPSGSFNVAPPHKKTNWYEKVA